jgi:hypothetical protein
MAMTRWFVVGCGASVCAVVAYLCLFKTKFIQTLAIRFRAPRQDSWESDFLGSSAYLAMVRFVGVLAGLNTLILMWVLYRYMTR